MQNFWKDIIKTIVTKSSWKYKKLSKVIQKVIPIFLMQLLAMVETSAFGNNVTVTSL